MGPCRCGDTVVTNTKLHASDPVLKAPCPCNGLFVASGVTLEIGGAIRSQNNVCSGIRVEPGAANVVVKIGRIVGFDIGIETDFFGRVTGSRFSRLQIVDSVSASMLVTGDDYVIESNVITRAGLAGIDVFGARNVVSLNRTEEGDVFGIAVGGSGHVVSRNLASRNGFAGYFVYGDNGIVDRNRRPDNLRPRGNAVHDADGNICWSVAGRRLRAGHDRVPGSASAEEAPGPSRTIGFTVDGLRPGQWRVSGQVQGITPILVCPAAVRAGSLINVVFFNATGRFGGPCT